MEMSSPGPLRSITPPAATSASMYSPGRSCPFHSVSPAREGTSRGKEASGERVARRARSLSKVVTSKLGGQAPGQGSSTVQVHTVSSERRNTCTVVTHRSLVPRTLCPLARSIVTADGGPMLLPTSSAALCNNREGRRPCRVGNSR